jgi:hypothetical protein
MECAVKDELEQHVSDIRKLAARLDLMPDGRESVRGPKGLQSVCYKNTTSGHNGKRCPFATLISST